MHYWLIKSEPTTFSIHDLARSKNKTTCWEGVRNYQARNFLRAMKKGDRAIFYHSNAKPPAAVGIVEVIKEAYPDHFGWKEGHKYQDAKASPEKTNLVHGRCQTCSNLLPRNLTRTITWCKSSRGPRIAASWQ